MSVHLRRAELVFGYAESNGLRRQHHSGRNGFHRRDQFGDNLSLVSPSVLGSAEECKSVAAAANVLHFGKATDESIRDPEGLGQVVVAHREKSPLTGGLNAELCFHSSGAKHRYRHVLSRGYRSVNARSVPSLLKQPAQVADKRSRGISGQGSAQNNAALLAGVVGFLKINKADDADQFVPHFDVAALAQDALHNHRFRQRELREPTHHPVLRGAA